MIQRTSIERTMIDLSTCPRRAHFMMFRDMGNPYVGMTAQIAVTGFERRVREGGAPHFLTFLYEAARAANAVPALRQRIEDGGIAEYGHCLASCTVARADGTFGFMNLDPTGAYEDYLPRAREAMSRAREGGELDTSIDGLPVFFMSCIPWVRYTALAQPTPVPADSVPRITWGRCEGGVVPVTLLAHHALVDGAHIARFFELIEANLNS